MLMQGGGATSHAGVKTYIDLIVANLSDIESEFPQTAELFAAFAKHRQGQSNFGYAEIDKDDRLKDGLSKTKEGADFFLMLKTTAPLISVSSNILADPANIANVKIFPLHELEKDPLTFLNDLAKAVPSSSQSEQNNFLDGIDKLNKIISLKPGMFGISINLNGIIEEWLRKKKSPKQ